MDSCGEVSGGDWGPFTLGELSGAVGGVGELLKAARLARVLGCLTADSEISLLVEP